MEIVNKRIVDIFPYENNPRKNDKAVDLVANSIRSFGFKVPIVIDANNVIVCGHTRYKAAKKLSLETVPCVVADDLTEEQVKAFRLADNKVAEAADWDFEMLSGELKDILDFDMSDFGFELPEDDDEDSYFGDERERTYESTNLNDVDLSKCAGKWQMPIVEASHHRPKDLLSFNYMLTSHDFEKGIHFYIDDYQFERLWNQPYVYTEKLRMFDCVLTPDWSMYLDMPLAMQMWNCYRSKMIGQIMQNEGIEVIPTLQWSTKESYEFCFDGIQPGGVYSVSTIGVKEHAMNKGIWWDGMTEAVRRLKPECIVIYGGDIGFKFPCETIYINNHNAERLRNL